MKGYGKIYLILTFVHLQKQNTSLYGKHIAIECQKTRSSLYYSIVLMAVSDARYCFTLVNVADFGSNSDSSILAKSSTGKGVEKQKMKVPNAKPVLGYKGNLPYFLVGDEISPLKTWLIRRKPSFGNQLKPNLRMLRNMLWLPLLCITTFA